MILVYIQSSQVYYHNGYQWNKDLQAANRDLNKCYEEITKDYTIDKNSMMVGGFSPGGMISFYFTLENIVLLKVFKANSFNCQYFINEKLGQVCPVDLSD
jgi:predicted esterase